MYPGRTTKGVEGALFNQFNGVYYPWPPMGMAEGRAGHAAVGRRAQSAECVFVNG